MTTENRENCVVINEQRIPWSFVFRVHKECGGDWDRTIDCFWRARRATGRDAIVRYISACLRRTAAKGKVATYCVQPSTERELGKMEDLRRWWATLYDRKRAPASLREIAAAIAPTPKAGETQPPITAREVAQAQNDTLSLADIMAGMATGTIGEDTRVRTRRIEEPARVESEGAQ
jgi:hypothetical protein